MRLRTIVLIAGGLAVIGSIVWSYGGGGEATAIGAGGLPLIKADATPVKIPPEEGMVTEIIPNAESTVFAAMGTEDAQDPSMENITPPTEDQASGSDFAGFRTGFALPKEAPRKTESLFEDLEKEKQDANGEENTEEAASQYLSGLAPEAVGGTAPAAQTPETVPEPVTEPIEEPVAEAAPSEPKAEEKTVTEEKPESAPTQEPVETTETAAEAETATTAPIPQDNISAQALEAQEKILVRPASKPVMTKKMPPEKAEEKQPEKPEPKKEPAFDAVKLAEKAAPQEKPAATKPEAPEAPADDVYPIKPAAPTAVSGSYYIQLASAPKGTDMQATWRQLQARGGTALAGLTPSFPEAEIAGKGTFVRVQAGPLSRDEANRRCTALRAANPNGGCLVIRK